MKIVIDFSGYYYKNKFIIKEFSLCRLDYLSVITEPITITKDPQNAIPLQANNKSYKNFIDKFGVKNSHNLYPVYVLRSRLMRINHENNKIYVRNGEQLSKLISFINNSKYQSDKIKLLSDLGFDDNYELTETNCPHHINKSNNYCAGDNAKLMAEWLIERKVNKINSRRNMQLVINFSGYRDYKNKFKIKELSIHGLNDDGNIVYHKLCVIKPVYVSNDSINNINKKKYDNYYNKFGIKYDDGYYELQRMRNEIYNIVTRCDIQVIYVKNYHYYDLLTYVFGDIEKYDVTCLEDHNYVEAYDINTNCGYHTHEDNSKNICVNNSVINMVKWILTNKFYKSEVRNRFSEITLNDDINIDDELVNQFIIGGNDELPLISSDDLEL
ncbi:uncharacterized protein LOC130675531 [Microplitis mediator]|uniref:uncharacterized protein LOC130675531 n=1 Tax=Microplitis mediator TaxID=375433 RepID=UPI0025538900|nr:uncharacterized protein LOC130675531 [Microplitis mediator]